MLAPQSSSRHWPLDDRDDGVFQALKKQRKHSEGLLDAARPTHAQGRGHCWAEGKSETFPTVRPVPSTISWDLTGGYGT